MKISKKFGTAYARRMGLDLDEFDGAAYEGLSKAAGGFDFGRGFRFTTYAHITVTRSCRTHLRFLRGQRRFNGKDDLPIRRQTWRVRGAALKFTDMAVHDAVRAGDRGRASAALGDEADAREAAGRVWERLSEREREALGLRVRGVTLKVTGEVMGLTRERVRQIVSGVGCSAGIRAVAG